MVIHLFRGTMALLATAFVGYHLYVLLPFVVSSRPLDGGSLLAIGIIVSAYGFFMAFLINTTYRAKMDGPAKPKDAPPPDEDA